MADSRLPNTARPSHTAQSPHRHRRLRIAVAIAVAVSVAFGGAASAQDDPIDTFRQWILGKGEEKKKQAEQAERQRQADEAREKAEAERKARQEQQRREAERRERSPDAVDQLLLASSSTRRQLDRIEQAIADEQFEEAGEALLEFLGSPAEAWVWDADARQVRSARQIARERLAALPEAERLRIAKRSSPTADSQLREAMRSRSIDRLAEIADEHLLTPAGQRAAVEWAAAQLDSGRVHTVIRWRQQWSELGPALDARIGRRLDELAAAAEAQLARIGRPDDRLSRVAAGGSLDGSQQPAEGSPTTLPLWERRSSLGGTLRDQIGDAQFAIGNAREAQIPIAEPLIVGGRVVWRDLRGLHAADLQTGRGWSRALDDGYIAAAAAQPDSAWFGAAAANPAGSPLIGLLYRDSVYGSLSTDGRFAFAVVDDGRLDPEFLQNPDRRRLNIDRDAAGRFEVNRLQAWDIRTGRLAWELGGIDRDDLFDLPLAGTFFLGPPIAFENRLYAVVEQAGEIRLVVLSARDGSPLWSRSLAMAPEAIGVAHDRRAWACTPSIAGGLVVCPTNTGWLAAIDHQTRRIVWTRRLLPRTEETRTPSPRYRGTRSRAANWRPQRTAIHGGTVHVLALEHAGTGGRATDPILHALDLATGGLRYLVERSELRVRDRPIGLCGFDGDSPLLYGPTGVVRIDPPPGDADPLLRPLTAADLAARGSDRHGRQRWAFDLRPGDALSGTPILTGDGLAVPIDGDRLVEVDLKSGQANGSRAWLGEIPVGNLAYGGQSVPGETVERFVSVSPLGVAAISRPEELTLPPAGEVGSAGELVRLLQVALATDALDRIGDYLTRLPEFADELSGPTLERAVAAIEQTFLRQIDGADAILSADVLAVLDERATTDRQRLAVARMRYGVSRSPEIQSRRLLAILDDPQTLRASVPGSVVRQTGVAWWGRTARLLDASLDAPTRQMMRDAVTERIGPTMPLDEALLLAEVGRYAEPLLAVANEWAATGRPDDALPLARRIRAAESSPLEREPNLVLIDEALAIERASVSRTLGDGSADDLTAIAARRSGIWLDRRDAAVEPTDGPSEPIGPSWSRPVAIRSLTQTSRTATRVARSPYAIDPVAAVARLAFSVDETGSSPRVYAVDLATGTRVGDFSWATGEGDERRRPFDADQLSLVLCGDEVYAASGPTLVRLDPATMAPVWRHDLPAGSIAADSRSRRSDDESDSQEFSRESTAAYLFNRMPRPRAIVGASRTRIYLRTEREILAIDRATGLTSWSVRSSQTTRPFALPSGLLIETMNEGTRFHDERDGHPTPVRTEAFRESGGVAAVGEGLVVSRIDRSQQENGRRSNSVVVARYELDRLPDSGGLTLRQTWRHRLSELLPTPERGPWVAYFGRGSDEPLVLFDGARVALFDLISGTLRGDGADVPAEGSSISARSVGKGDVQIFRDEFAYYVVPERRSMRQFGYISNVDTERVGGRLRAVRRSDGQPLWSSEIEQTMAAVTGLPRQPFLAFMWTSLERIEGQNVSKLQIELIDKRTGQPLLTEQRLIGRSRITGLHYDPAASELEVRLDNWRLLLRPDAADKK